MGIDVLYLLAETSKGRRQAKDLTIYCSTQKKRVYVYISMLYYQYLYRFEDIHVCVCAYKILCIYMEITGGAIDFDLGLAIRL